MIIYMEICKFGFQTYVFTWLSTPKDLSFAVSPHNSERICLLIKDSGGHSTSSSSEEIWKAIKRMEVWISKLQFQDSQLQNKKLKS